MTAQHDFVFIDSLSQSVAETVTVSANNGLKLKGAGDWFVTQNRLSGGRSDGMHCIRVNNGAIELDVLPTRGMGIWRGMCGDIRLGWDSPVAQPVHPAHVNLESRNQLGWLDGFNEWICRCGLAFNGPPGPDDDGTPITLHGRIANLPAHHVSLRVDETGDGSLTLTGVVDETSMFGTNLRLTSELILPAGKPTLKLIDTVTNRSSHRQEFELLYHINQGSPLLEADSQVSVPFREMAPRDPRAAKGTDSWQTYRAAASGYAEQVYFFDPVSDGDRWSAALLSNAAADSGMLVRFETSTLPYLAVWKNTQAMEDGYCTGIEPCTDFPNHRSFERTQGRLRHLAPGASESMQIEIEIASGSERVAELRKQIDQLQASVTPIVHQNPNENFSAS